MRLLNLAYVEVALSTFTRWYPQPAAASLRASHMITGSLFTLRLQGRPFITSCLEMSHQSVEKTIYIYYSLLLHNIQRIF